jgi:hypothetical protein
MLNQYEMKNEFKQNVFHIPLNKMLRYAQLMCYATVSSFVGGRGIFAFLSLSGVQRVK